MDRASRLGKYAHWIAVSILVLGLVFYLYRIDAWFMHDDEGGYCYAAWRIAEGEVPYRDFLTPQLPLFLYWGGMLVRILGPSILVLRYATVLATLGAAWFLYLGARRAFGWRVALLSLPLFLLHKDVYFIARFFRPEAYMLLFSAAATYAFLATYPRRSRWGSLLAGALLGLAMLCKLFAALPAAGFALFLLYEWFRTRDRSRLDDIAALSLGFCATVGTVFLVFQSLEPYFLTAVLGHHAMQGAELGPLSVVTKALGFYWGYFKSNPVFIMLALLGAAKSRIGKTRLSTFLVWQLPTVAAFLLLSRDLQDRHLVYLVPVLSSLAASALEPLFDPQRTDFGSLWGLDVPGQRSLGGLPKITLGVLLAALALWPSLSKDLQVASWEEDGTQPLAQYIQALTDADDYVLCDYPGVNFHAQRINTYLGAGLSGGATSSGQITGEALIQEIEKEDVKMVLINTAGGAHQLVNLRDYADFRQYVQSRFPLIRMFNRSYQTFEIYYRNERMPLLPDAEFGGKLALTGADLGAATVHAGQVLSVTLRWQAVNAMQRDYTVSLRLVDQAGHRYGQQDVLLLRTFTDRWEGPQEIIEHAPTSRWPAGEVVMDDYPISVPYGTPPGHYRLLVLLYDLASGQVLQPLDGDKALGTECVLGSIEVVRTEEAVHLDELPIQHPLVQNFGDQLKLLGYAPLVEQARPGDVVHLGLFWQSLRQMETDWQVLVQIQAAAGEVVAAGQFELASPSRPTSEWAEGEVVLGYYDLALDRSAPSGQAQIVLDLVDAHTQQRLLGHDWVLASFDIAGGVRQFEAPEAIQHPLTVNFGDRVLLLGYDVDAAALKPGNVLNLTLYWQALSEMDISYTVFTHLLDNGERIWGQKDGVPVRGMRPTTGWLSGEVIVDAYEIEVAVAAPAGWYTPEIGLYDAATSERLPLLDAEGQTIGDRVLLSPIQLMDD
jgi:4-amino-4-deoxy-L-arabinose transferase-like glycosyltransferase